MALLKCNTCGGEFDDLTADGLRYFHACAPLSPAALRDALDAGTVILPARAQRRLDVLALADETLPNPAGTPSRVDLFLATLAIDRPRARNENVDLRKAAAALDDSGKRRATVSRDDLMQATGQGVTTLG